MPYRFIMSIIITVILSMTVSNAQSNIQVVASTNIIADVAQNIAGDLAEVTSVTPQGADAHSYLPSPAEVIDIIEADVIFVNGALLEENLLEIIEENAEVDLTIVSNGVEVLAIGEHDHEEDDETEQEETLGILGEDAECEHHDEGEEAEEGEEEHEHGTCDPHFWMNPANVIIWANNIADVLSTADPDNADSYRANANAYIEEINTLMTDIEALLDPIPADERVIVTNHDFLGYFAHAYNFEVVGVVVPGGSTFGEPSAQDLIELVEEIEEEGVRAIFAETSSPTDLAQTVADEVGYDVQVVELYSGSLSQDDDPASTYLDYMRFNVNAIVSALTTE